MPAYFDTSFFQPESDVEFESLIRDLCVEEWEDPYAEKFGRKGQKQYGVDVYGSVQSQGTMYRAAQCKLRKHHDPLTQADIQHEVNEAKKFPHRLDELIIATTCPRDTNTQLAIDAINQQQKIQEGFRVSIWFWDNITTRVVTYRYLLVKYYGSYLTSLTTSPLVESLVDQPLYISWSDGSTTSTSLNSELRTALQARGIRIGIRIPQTTLDGAVLWYEGNPLIESDLHIFVGQVRGEVRNAEKGCPLFVLLPPALRQSFQSFYEQSGPDKGSNHVYILTQEQDTQIMADTIFSAAFQYGFERRGAIPTIDLAFRTLPTTTRFTLLDVDWQSWLSTETFPTSKEWKQRGESALRTIRSAILNKGNTTRIQIRSLLPLPAALAVGYFFNIRVAQVGVWVRALGGSGFSKQFWWSNTAPADVTYPVHWVKSISTSPRHAVIELTTHLSMQEPIGSFIKDEGYPCDGWAQLQLDPSKDIDASQAVAYANQAGQLIRDLAAKGVTDFHLFLRMPSPLALLVGQRLQACGHIHLYWYTNPSYKFAFTLS